LAVAGIAVRVVTHGQLAKPGFYLLVGGLTVEFEGGQCSADSFIELMLFTGVYLVTRWRGGDPGLQGAQGGIDKVGSCGRCVHAQGCAYRDAKRTDAVLIAVCFLVDATLGVQTSLCGPKGQLEIVCATKNEVPIWGDGRSPKVGHQRMLT
jgi:hypothetical protein